MSYMYIPAHLKLVAKIRRTFIMIDVHGPNEKVREYDQEIPHMHNADQPTTPRGRAEEHQETALSSSSR